MRKNYEEMTQKYSTFGSKLLQHCDVLDSIQREYIWKPITVQLSLTSACGFRCSFCSVQNRPQGVNIPIKTVKKSLLDFKELGAKALEITGGGEPLLYEKVNEVIEFADTLKYDIGVISSYPEPKTKIQKRNLEIIKWLRVSLNGLDENLRPEHYNFHNIPKGKLAFSYIINDRTNNQVLNNIYELVQNYPEVKFVRIAGDCLSGKNLKRIKRKWGKKIERINQSGKFFVKEINNNYLPFKKFCGVGAVRPYCVEDGKIYICTSHVLKNRTYDKNYIIGDMNNVKEMYALMNIKRLIGEPPYDINVKKCFHCFYYNNNKILYEITRQIPDKNFA